MTLGCEAYGQDLGPFVDGELDGGRMLRLSRHLEECETCASALEEVQQLGGLLRAGGISDPAPRQFDGFAASVVARSAAERSLSWRGTWERAVDGWHWAIVGGGSLAATVLSTSLLSFMLAFGAAPHREDSLSAMADNMSESSGFLFVYASPVGEPGQDVVMLQVENGRPAAPPLVSDLVVSRTNTPATEAELVARLHELVMRDGRIVSLDALGTEQRLVAEALLDEITRLRARTVRPTRSFRVHEMRLVTSVSAKRS